MLEEKEQMFRNRLTKVYRHLGKQAKRLNISCYRVYDRDLPEYPLCIEIYEDKIYVAEYKRRYRLTEERHSAWLEKSKAIIAEVLSVPVENIYLKTRQRKAGRTGQYQKQDQSKNEFVVNEHGLKFFVNLQDYLDTGLFLDHRNTRQLVKDSAGNKSVLNLFAYTGSFSVYAAAGGALRVVTIDLSKTYLDWAERNFRLNDLINDGEKYQFIHADVMEWLKKTSNELFDIIILDPPTFSNSQRMDDILDIQRDHVELINNSLRLLNRGGMIYFSTNYLKFELQQEKIKSREIKDITRMTTPFDFEGRNIRLCYRIN